MAQLTPTQVAQAGALADTVTKQNQALQAALLTTYDDNEKAAFDEGRLIGAAQLGGLLMAAQITAAQAAVAPSA